MVIIKTAILQTHVYTDKFRNITPGVELLASPELQGIDLAVLPKCSVAPTRTNTSRKYAEPERRYSGENVPDWLTEHGIYLM